MPAHLSTQTHLDIVDIVDQYVIHKTGVSCVVQPSPVNFDLLSEREQDTLINTFAGFLNSLTFHIQVVVRTRRTDITNYLHLLEQEYDKQQNPFLKERIQYYLTYIEQLSTRKDVLAKKFYVVVPYVDTGLSAKKSVFDILRTSQPKINTSEVLSRAKNIIDPRVSHVSSQMARMGVGVKVLQEKELVRLFYDIYNPTTATEEHVDESLEDYVAPMVQVRKAG